MVKASEIVAAARQLEGAYYRWWYVGASLPMWLDDGHAHPPVEYIMEYGVMCSDLLNWSRQECGLPPIGGTTDYANAIVNWSAFDPSVPGVPGAVCVNPYYSPDQQGHVALYTGEHQIIQALVNPGVTEAYTDVETSTWACCGFTWYGFMNDVDYYDAEDEATPPPPAPAWQRNGWYQIEDNWDLTYNGPAS
jgi:cell wall-associated NlpC family hydrolase